MNPKVYSEEEKLLDGIINNCAIGNDELVLIIILKYQYNYIWLLMFLRTFWKKI